MIRIVKYTLLAGIFLFCSCEENLLEKEQYKKVIYVLSQDNNIFRYSHALNDSVTRGYLTVGSGGTMPLKEDVSIIFEPDPALLEEYNRRNFDIDYGKYAKQLPFSRYILPSYEVILKAGNADATTFFPVEVDANGLSPDTTYMIPLKIKSASSFEINPEKACVLYQVELKNSYSEPGKNTYTMKGTKQPEGGIQSAITATKTVTPIAKDRIRIFPENILPSTELADIENNTLIIIVNEDHTLRLKPFRNIMLEQQENNRYNKEDEIFSLHYRYKPDPDQKWITVDETLRRIR